MFDIYPIMWKTKELQEQCISNLQRTQTSKHSKKYLWLN